MTKLISSPVRMATQTMACSELYFGPGYLKADVPDACSRQELVEGLLAVLRVEDDNERIHQARLFLIKHSIAACPIKRLKWEPEPDLAVEIAALFESDSLIEDTHNYLEDTSEQLRWISCLAISR